MEKIWRCYTSLLPFHKCLGGTLVSISCDLSQDLLGVFPLRWSDRVGTHWIEGRKGLYHFLPQMGPWRLLQRHGRLGLWEALRFTSGTAGFWKGQRSNLTDFFTERLPGMRIWVPTLSHINVTSRCFLFLFSMWAKATVFIITAHLNFPYLLEDETVLVSSFALESEKDKS